MILTIYSPVHKITDSLIPGYTGLMGIYASGITELLIDHDPWSQVWSQVMSQVWSQVEPYQPLPLLQLVVQFLLQLA